MRFRYKPWALPEIEASPFVCTNPEEYKNNWSSFFDNPELPLSLELGCGKGRFLQELSQSRPDYNYLGIDIEILAVAKANRLIAPLKPKNARLLNYDISKIYDYFAENEASEIFINFANPWPKTRHNKRRLTHPRQLIQYRKILKDYGEIWFKTDDQELYEKSLEYFELMNFKILNSTESLVTDSSKDPRSILTEYEERWRNDGINIKAIYVQKLPGNEEELAEIAKNYKDERDPKFRD